MIKKEKIPAVVLTFLVAVQVFLFVAYVEREVAWDYMLHGDPTWYTYFSYRVFDGVIYRNWDIVWQQAVTSPWGVLLFIQSVIPQLLFGPVRASVVSINLFYYLIAQLATYYFFTKVSRSYLGGFIALGLFLVMSTPFRKGLPDLNITDFHFDLVFFFGIVVLYYLVAWSNTFQKRLPSVVVGVVAAFIVANRLVGIFLFAGVFGVFFIFLLFKHYTRPLEVGHARIKNFLLASGVYVGCTVIPVVIALKALYAHYFRFLFDPQFAHAREGLYVMGASTKFQEAYLLVVRMVVGDFGIFFGAAAVIIFILAVFSAYLMRKAGITTGIRFQTLSENSGGNAGQIKNLTSDKIDYNLYISFLLIAIAVSYLQHLFFPIKSDHLTRMTAAPIFVLLCLAVVPRIIVMYNSMSAHDLYRRFMLFTFLCIGVLALFVQLGFYSGTGRHSGLKHEAPKIHDMYNDITQIVVRRGQKELAISVDFLRDFELGALMSFFTYAYEKHGLLLTPLPKLGGINDEPVTSERARQLIDASDIVLLTLTEKKSAAMDHFPFMKSMRDMRPEVMSYVKRHFCHYKNYYIAGLERSLYIRPKKWNITASASTATEYGPGGLLTMSGQIWHAPWNNDIDKQWLRFDAVRPVIIRGITLVSQDGAPDRAPRDFVIEASSDEKKWVRLLKVTDARFSFDRQALSWKLNHENAFSKYRMVITGNGGHPALLTIQAVKILTEPDVVCDGTES